MQSFSIGTCGFHDLLNQISDDELTIIISPRSAPSEGVKGLIKKSSKPLSKVQEDLSVHGGFLAGNEKLWFAPVFGESVETGFERRWLFHEWSKSLQSRFSLKKLVVFFDVGCSPAELVLAEDLYTLFLDPLFCHSKWSEFRVFSADISVLTAGDRAYQLRFTHQLAYRQWVNENPDSLTSIEMGDRLRKFATETGCTFMTLEESALRDESMNLLLAVAQGAKRSPARLHILTKNLAPGQKPLALIGKGITFDSGGINLKPHESFVNCMKNDMGGAALMSQLFMGLIKYGYEGPLVLAVPCCENAIDSMSMKPGVIIKSRKGKSVIIEHTDAEGRLILADTMSYVWDKFSPKQMITAATLTTAALRQFSGYVTPVHFSSKDFQQSLEKSAKMFGECFTFWGAFRPFANGNKTNAADLTNMGRLPSHSSMGGGSNVAAHFLKEFAEGPFAHIDIFNTIWNWSGDYPGAHYGCTGSVFNSLWSSFVNDSVF